MQSKQLQVSKLSKSYNKFKVLRDVSFEVSRASSFAMLGPNGSGKTTLLKALMGSVWIDSGQVILDGQSQIQSAAYKEKLVYMPQHPGFLAHLSASEIVSLIIQLRNQPAVRAERLIKELKIDQFWSRPFGDLSGGMKQKINILQCFMFEFEIAFLDEPTASLDPEMAWYLKNLIKEMRSLGKTICFTSHIMSEVEDLADHMVLLNNGRVVIDSPPGEFVKKQQAANLEEALLDYWTVQSSGIK